MPQELIDRTIDLLRGDTAALRACSLTHSALRSRAQFHIYHTVHFTPERWTKYDALAKQSPHLGNNVRRLHVEQPVGLLTRSSLQSARAYGYEQFARPRTTRGPPLFPAATTLELQMLDKTALSPLLLSNVCDLRTIEAIYLRACIVFNMGHVAEFICNFPRLRSLSLCDLFTADDYRPGSTSKDRSYAITASVNTTVPPALEELRFVSNTLILGAENSISLTKWLFEQGMHARLSTLEISAARRADVATLSACLGQLGPRLQRLYLAIEQQDDDASLSDPLTLSSNTGLRTLGLWGLKLHADTESRRPRPSLAWVPRVLKELGTPVLEHVHLQFRAGGTSPSDFDTLDWAAINDILCDQRFGSLRRVTIELLRGYNIKDAMWPYVEARMAELHARGIVVHTYSSI
ncbi:hypothetical protein FOMPIDRAFT_38207 [Fomitopsis schrenkii]|uniref:F-box domain-containing protein n=1 Tax=Fomitopsis schrenkii TaxID=2126942 RepID=S8DYY4_FOMSC|nr:hypothetical protein FOMPIDRAFT_38207 [Fomitopsis schrenkii]